MKVAAISSVLATVICAVSASPLIITPPTTQDAPDPTKVYINGVTYGGSGCPAGSVSQVLSDDKSTVTLIFDSYVASVGPGIAVTESRKNCQLNFDLHYPSGWQYSVFKADYRGFAQMDPGVTGVQKSIYYFSGDTKQTTTQSTFNGPYNQDYLLSDVIDNTSTVWSPCGVEGMLNINSQVRVYPINPANVNAKGQLTTDSIDGHFQHIIGVQWQKCTTPK